MYHHLPKEKAVETNKKIFFSFFVFFPLRVQYFDLISDAEVGIRDIITRGLLMFSHYA